MRAAQKLCAIAKNHIISHRVSTAAFARIVSHAIFYEATRW
eukprot:SAG11_NODE_20446_length_445_cov_0.598266_2_plen_40_part_01